MKTEKSKPILFVDLSAYDVESKNASSINVTLSLFLFSHPLAIKFNGFVLKYLLNIKRYINNCLIVTVLFHISFVCVQIYQQKALFSCHVTRGGRYIDEKLSKADKLVFLKLSAIYRY